MADHWTRVQFLELFYQHNHPPWAVPLIQRQLCLVSLREEDTGTIAARELDAFRRRISLR
jgi:hypothetical protein